MDYYDDEDLSNDNRNHLILQNSQISETEINQLEKMFISKLTEKYRLIDRDLKKG